MSQVEVKPQIEESWLRVLRDEFTKPYFATIKSTLLEERQRGITIYPAGKDIFRAFESTPIDKVKVVILGQDPYHGPGQAHGLCFSVPKGITQPPSLKNIFKEINTDLGIPIPDHGDLSHWAEQGVFLLNAMLTVRAKQAASHQQIGWQEFTNTVIEKISAEREGVVFMLWGRFARNKEVLIDTSIHHVLTAAHPSPLSAHNGFFGCKHFSKANELLEQQGLSPIDWNI